MFTIIIGILLVIAGISGQFVDKLTHTSGGLIVFGVVGIIWGIIRVARGN
jgi:F0F1-type ATP synthase assembly protein I